MGFGGAGSLHSNAVAKLMNSWPVIVPRSPGVLCAVGDATTQARSELSRSHSKKRSQTNSSEIAKILKEMTFNMDAEHEVVNLRAVALGKALELPAMKIKKGNGDPKDARMRSTQVYIDGEMKKANIYDRDKLRSGDIIKGPAIIIEMDHIGPH